ncbi:MAG: hypothetical protein WC464_03260 [Bdellovibrionales bacterium]
MTERPKNQNPDDIDVGTWFLDVDPAKGVTNPLEAAKIAETEKNYGRASTLYRAAAELATNQRQLDEIISAGVRCEKMARKQRPFCCQGLEYL